MLQRSPRAITRDHGARNTRSSFGQQSLWCWSSWRSLYGAGGRDSSKVALGGLRGRLRRGGLIAPNFRGVVAYMLDSCVAATSAYGTRLWKPTPGTSSTRLSRHVLSSHGNASRGVSWHQPTATSPSNASKPRRGALHDLAKRRFVLIARPVAIVSADPPIHAPAATASTFVGEQILEGGQRVVSFMLPAFASCPLRTI
jgi:hypothetical protein